MLIAIDYDNTLTRNCRFWRHVIGVASEFDVRFICVTSRRDTPENRKVIEDWMLEHRLGFPVYFTGLKSKIDHMAKLGIKVDIWIDDDPVSLVRGH